MMRSFFKGFFIGLIGICLVALVGLFIVQPQITASGINALKKECLEFVPGATGSGDLPAGEKNTEACMNFTALQARHPTIQGWLTIPGTEVDYPVLQSTAEQPEYYLRRNYKGEWCWAGSLFFQWDCTVQSQNIVIYGHNMNDGTMFATLPKLADTEYRTRHSEVLFQTADGLRRYQIITVLKTDDTKIGFNRTSFADDKDFLNFVENLIAMAQSPIQYTPQAADRLLILVTCSYEWEGARTVVVAVQK